nr:UvrB/UvrC motif-containing protein [Phycisphaerae bacterium]
QDVRRLKRALSEAVAAEDYERAARLRDQIRKMEES